MTRYLLRVGLAGGLLLFLHGSAVAAKLLIVGADAGGGPHVIIRADVDANGTFETEAASFFAFEPEGTEPWFTGGVRVAAGDLDGDGSDELITAMGPGGGLVRTWRLGADGRIGALLDEFEPYPGFRGGVFVTAGNFNGGAQDLLVTGPDMGGGPHVIVWQDFNRNGHVTDDPRRQSFYAYDPNFTGGVRVAAGNTNLNAWDELIVAPGPGMPPQVRIFDFDRFRCSVHGFICEFFTLSEVFYAYAPGFLGGIYVAAGPIAGIGATSEAVIVAPGTGGGPHVRIFADRSANGRVSDDALIDEFLAYTPAFGGGVRVAAGGRGDAGASAAVITGPGPRGGPHIRVLNDDADSGGLISDNPSIDDWMAMSPAFAGGVFVAVASVQTP